MEQLSWNLLDALLLSQNHHLWLFSGNTTLKRYCIKSILVNSLQGYLKTTYHKYKMRINRLFYLDMQSLDIFLKENFAFCNSSTSLYGLYTWDSFLLNLCKYIFQKDALMFLCWEFIYLQKRLNKKFEMPTSYFKMKGLNFLSIIWL